MRKNIWAFCGGPTWKSHWKDGEGGFEWKNRYLDEQRSRAMDFLFDVSKRKPIHDSIREYHNHLWNESAPVDGLRDAVHDYDPDLREQKMRAGVMGDLYSASARADSDAQRSLPENESEDIFSKIAHAQSIKAKSFVEEAERDHTGGYAPCGMEDFGDALEHLSGEDLELLADEFCPKTTHVRMEEKKLMSDVMGCRRTMSPRLSYAKIPQQERTTWSPWYLRHVTKPDKDE